MAKSAIEWTEATWNPTTGCDRVSEGCDNCYALTLASRLKAMGQPKYQVDGDPRTSGPGFGLTLHHDVLTIPAVWREPRTVFVNSMSDLFHPSVPLDFVREVFSVIQSTPQHTFQVLTKRSKRLADVASQLPWPNNLWIGVSIESDAYTFRARHLRQVPAAVRFLSLEPLLGPLPSLDLADVDWVIVGGESGPSHRPIEESWVVPIKAACLTAGVPFFFKQWGGRTSKAGGRVLDGTTWDAMPTVRARSSGGKSPHSAHAGPTTTAAKSSSGGPRAVRRIVSPRAEGGYEIMAPGAKRASAVVRTRGAAERRAKQIVRNLGGGEVTFEDKRGRVVHSDIVAWGDEPARPHDGKC